MLMYQYHETKIWSESVPSFFFTDTVSLCLCYEVKTHDIYQDMLEDGELFKTSGYARDHSLQNAKKICFSKELLQMPAFLGAHIAGYTGKRLARKNVTLGRITDNCIHATREKCLDPARPQISR
ncbi:Hypothetical predicted protein, partial [Paramuricea clavata]